MLSAIAQPTLPTEIWLLITAYLSSKDVRGLLGVNRQLTDLALNSRYRTAVAAPCLMRQYLEGPCSFIHISPDLPQVLHRVREVVFKDDPPVVLYTPVGNFYIPVYRLAPFKMLFSSKHHALRRYFKQLLRRVSELENVEGVTFHFTKTSSWTPRNVHQPYAQHKLKIFCALTAARPSQITRLSIQTNLNTIIPYWPASLMLPNLTEFRVKVLTHHITNTQPIFDFIHPLINTHRLSIKELEITHAPWLELKDVLQGMEHMPLLQKFALCWFIQDTPSERQEVSRFMETHACQLVELRLRLNPYHLQILNDAGSLVSANQENTTALNSCFDFTFPSLRHLSLHFEEPLSDEMAPPLRKFLLHHADQLLSLALLPSTMYPEGSLPSNVTPYFQLDGGLLIPFSLLQELSIYLNVFDFDLITFLASSLPQLQYLSIKGLLSLAIPWTTRGSDDAERLLRSWRLSDMVLLGETLRWKFDDKYRLTRLFAGVERICGQTPMEWVNGEERHSDYPLPLRTRVAPDYYDRGYHIS
ncbi:hypothetical protein BJ165DRAFT_1469258 [Panaeolus papilionaceus]|nr:hypothetical protein BJ165DRAFT_1469258 [Panaeolus papilionaceus]